MYTKVYIYREREIEWLEQSYLLIQKRNLLVNPFRILSVRHLCIPDRKYISVVPAQPV